jgi:hypothetical protein
VPTADGDAFALAYGPTQPNPPTVEASIIEGTEARIQKNIPTATPDELSILDGKFDSP